MNYSKQYEEIKSVFNPFFGKQIIFDIQGWNHLQKDGTGKPRSKLEIKARLEFLGLI